MKKLLTVSAFASLVLNIFPPLATLCVLALGYSFQLSSYSIYTIVVAVLSLAFTVLSFLCGEDTGKTVAVIASLQPLLVILNCIFCFFKCPSDDIWAIGITMMASLLFAVICAMKAGVHGALNGICISVSLLAVIPVAIFGFFVAVFGGFAVNTVVDTIPSPDGEHCVEVVYSDHGALGGDVFVRVARESIVDTVIFKIEKKPETLFVGEWDEYKGLNIRWKDNDSVILGSTEYEVD